MLACAGGGGRDVAAADDAAVVAAPSFAASLQPWLQDALARSTRGNRMQRLVESRVVMPDSTLHHYSEI